MAHAIANTVRSVAGSSLTTIAGFVALCFMSYTLGLNLGVVMAKGVLLGVIGSVTLLPSLILLFDKPLEKTMHRAILPKMDRFARLITKRSWIFLIVFVVLIVPALYGYLNVDEYYDLGQSLPDDMDFAIASDKLSEDFDIATTHMTLVSTDLSQKETNEMIDELDAVDGVTQTLGLNSLLGVDVPEDIIPDSAKEVLESDNYQLLLINSEYHVASDEVNNQIDELGAILKSYDSNAILIGEASCTKDMISITDHDFDVVTIISVIAIFIIIAAQIRKPARYSRRSNRVCDLHQSRYPVLYGPITAVHLADLHQHNSAGRYGGLRNPHDEPIYERTRFGHTQARGRHHRAFDFDAVDYRQRTRIICGNDRRRDLFQHRYHPIDVRTHGARCDHQHAVRHLRVAGFVHAAR